MVWPNRRAPAAEPPSTLLPAEPSPNPRIRLHFLDGLRGLAALYVLVFHALTIEVPQTGELSAPMRFVRQVFGYGHFAVAIFIVLSGFSLMLPIARAGGYELPNGFGPYIRRRARRLMPPYYAALVLSILSIVAYDAITTDQPGTVGPYDAALRPGSLVSHVFLVHNWNFDWAYRINGPMWSVATEWQIYFLMPLVLLPLWKRVGGAATLALTWGVTTILYFAIPDDVNLYWAAPWFIGSFALGMWGALFGFSDTDPARRFRGLPWGWITVALFAALVAVVATDNADWPYPLVDGLVSVFALALIGHCVQRASAGANPGVAVRFLGSRWVAYLGGFSYSLYLVQHPLLRLFENALGKVSSLSYEQTLIVAVLVVIPLVMLAAWVFSELVERPFTGGGVVLPWLRRRFGPQRPVAIEAPAPAVGS